MKKTRSTEHIEKEYSDAPSKRHSGSFICTGMYKQPTQSCRSQAEVGGSQAKVRRESGELEMRLWHSRKPNQQQKQRRRQNQSTHAEESGVAFAEYEDDGRSEVHESEQKSSNVEVEHQQGPALVHKVLSPGISPSVLRFRLRMQGVCRSSGQQRRRVAFAPRGVESSVRS